MSQGPALVISVSALQFGLLRLGQKAMDSIQIQNVSQLLATWCMKESLVCLQERGEDVSRVPTSSRAASPLPPRRCWQLVHLSWHIQSIEAGEEVTAWSPRLAVSPVLPISDPVGLPLTAELKPELDVPVPFSTVFLTWT